MNNQEVNVFHAATQSSRAQLGSGATTQSRDVYVNVQVDWENLEINWELFFSVHRLVA